MNQITKLLLAVFFLGISLFAKAQNIAITIVDENKEPLAGAAIYSKMMGEVKRSVTNLDGKCSFSTVDSFIVAFGGYKTQIIPTKNLKNDAIIQLELSNKRLSTQKIALQGAIIPKIATKNTDSLTSGAYKVTYFDEDGKEIESAEHYTAPIEAAKDRKASAPPPPPTIVTTSVAPTVIDEDRATLSEVVVTTSAPKRASSAPITRSEIRSSPMPATTKAKKESKPKRYDEAELKMPIKADEHKKVTGKIVEKDEKPAAPQAVKAHLLTVGEVNDFTKWTLWKDIALTQLEEHRKAWQVMPMQRYTVQVVTENGLPIVDAAVQLIENDSVVWAAKSDNTGKAEMWLDAFERTVAERSELALKVIYKGKIYDFSTVKRFQKGINICKLPVKCDMPNKIDVAFIVDATGSMGDEIDYLKAELTDIATRVKDSLRTSELRMGSVFYKDSGDDYLTIFSDFDANIKKADDFVAKQSADGGGDTPEAVDAGLEAALRDLKWSENAAARIAFLILDAPPHNTPEIKAKIERSIRKFAERGIRLIPVACSGTDKSTEYLMRSFALLTNGTYLALTDDSGIGGSHIKPTTDKMSVEFLNDAMVRLIMQFAKTPSCREQSDTKQVQRDTLKAVLPDTSLVKDPNKQRYAIPVYKIYPNPTAGMVYLDTDGSVGNIYLCDLNGKIISQIAINNRAKMQFDLTDYPAGTYLLRYEYAPDKWLTSKIIRVR